uniref:Interleukin-1 receptor-associated kinase 1-binding protein 1-like n=1 Tax=Saccoglossus kowalevskii TaxID=10224 RepID=A0ABM0GY89_SACKO|nr:PREDICTED: interleukin-1 receptor-associated kinase 1-binding protein 1-like [Saccoglossus kowalevskii]
MTDRSEQVHKLPVEREIQVSATGEAFLAPDRARVTITVTSTKENVLDAKNSVTRRLDYILQSLQTHGVKEGDIDIYKNIQRIDGLYDMNAEVTIQFVDFNKCQSVSNFLVEKLDNSVKVSQPQLYHSHQRLEMLRRQACLSAVRNAKQKALEVARMLRQALGKPIMIKEEYSHEWEGPAANEVPQDNEVPISFQQRISNTTITVSVKVYAAFELKPKEKGKQLESTLIEAHT